MKLMNTSKIRKLTAILLIMTIFCLYTSFQLAAYADEMDEAAQEITEGVTTGLDKAYSIIKAISIPVAVICLVVGGAKMFGSPKAMEEGKAILVRTTIAMAIIYLGPIIVKAISGWFGNYDISGTK